MAGHFPKSPAAMVQGPDIQEAREHEETAPNSRHIAHTYAILGSMSQFIVLPIHYTPERSPFLKKLTIMDHEVGGIAGSSTPFRAFADTPQLSEAILYYVALPWILLPWAQLTRFRAFENSSPNTTSGDAVFSPLTTSSTASRGAARSPAHPRISGHLATGHGHPGAHDGSSTKTSHDRVHLDDMTWPSDALISFFDRIATNGRFFPNLETLCVDWCYQRVPYAAVTKMLTSRWIWGRNESGGLRYFLLTRERDPDEPIDPVLSAGLEGLKEEGLTVTFDRCSFF
ncbi:hypothetical protein DFH09DRAFT_1084643 [Mycena vulgaris]|nr:hypothetical protein DFH09DRAFT_1084643 [Mycena vulgaris]